MTTDTDVQGSGWQGTAWQGSEWQGRVGDVWAREWRRTDRSFADLTPHLNAAILATAPATGRAIDLGCGAGETSIALATSRPGLNVTGIDISAELVAVAKERGAGIANLDFRAGDTAVLDSATTADFFQSRHGVMFFPDPIAAFTTIRAAATPGAGLVFSCFAPRALNPWVQVIDEAVENAAPPPAGYMPGPFGFADREFTAAMLRDSGWAVDSAAMVEYDYIAGAGSDPVADAVDFFSHIGPAARAIADAAPDRRPYYRDRLAKALASHETDGQVKMRAAVWIWTARAGEQA
jgi:SAM-dependent methyltransferase